MPCKKLKITDYFRLTPTTGSQGKLTGVSTGTSETAYSRFKPVVSVSITNYRYYSSELGRWLSRDPIEERGGYNLYAMVSNNPLDKWDRLGLESPPVPYLGIVVAGAGATMIVYGTHIIPIPVASEVLIAGGIIVVAYGGVLALAEESSFLILDAILGDDEDSESTSPYDRRTPWDKTCSWKGQRKLVKMSVPCVCDCGPGTFKLAPGSADQILKCTEIEVPGRFWGTNKKLEWRSESITNVECPDGYTPRYTWQCEN